MLQMVKQKWVEFEAKVASYLPGLKTRSMLALGAVGDLAFSIQGYVSSVPLDVYLNPRSLAVFNLVVVTLAYWFHGLNQRVEERE